MNDMSLLVHEQGEIINVVEKHFDKTVEHVTYAEKDLV